MVIAVFMAAVLVGVIWYMFGLGEAMIYRQHLRSAVDAAAFDSAVVHALGMNMIAMMNIAMAAVLSILVALMVVFIIGLMLTIIAGVLLLVPVVDVVDAGVFDALVNFDKTMFDVIQKVQPYVFQTLTDLNIAEGVVAIIMPFGGFAASMQAAGQYKGAVTSTSSFSPSMVPMRLLVGGPFFANKLDSVLKSKVPIIATVPKTTFTPKNDLKPNPLKLTPLQRYGLPVQDDTYGMLCMHAGMELVQELDLVVMLQPAPSAVVDKFGQIFGQVVGEFPWMFCAGVDPFQILKNLLGSWDPVAAGTIGAALKHIPILKEISKAPGVFKKTQDRYPSMFPMKPFDDSKNGNDFMQVWSSAHGSPTSTTGAITGVAIAGWNAVAAPPNQGGDDVDFAEAEFYFDCGGPGTEGDEVILVPGPGSTTDTTGDWQQCKYNAMWNMRWKARMRRYHQFQLDLRKEIELSLYQGLGLENFVKGFLPPLLQEGSGTKVVALDPIKACISSIGSGSATGTGDFGSCPLPIGSLFSFPNGGKIGLGSSTAAGYQMSQVLH